MADVRLRALVALVMLASPLTSALPNAAAAVQTGCQPTDSGYRCVYGPFEVSQGSNQFIQGVPAPPVEGFITSARATLIDESGTRVPQHMAHLHHAVWVNPTRDDVTCDTIGGFPAWERFFATGKERTRLGMPDGYGYYWSNQPAPGYEELGPGWVMVAELDGMAHLGPYTMDVYVRMNLSFTPGPPGTLTDVTPVWLDVRNCSADPVFDVARGSGQDGRYRERWTYQMPVGGQFVAMGGHLHDGGVRLVLRNVTAATHMFTSEAVYANRRRPWNLTGMTAFSGLPGIPVSAGDTVRLTAIYDSTRSWNDVMGIMVGALAPSAAG